ncbi:putative post-transcriptional gene silencing PAZ-Argonaute family [Helianthus anomalus]
MTMGICRQGSLSGGELGREIPSAVRGTVQLSLVYLSICLCTLSFGQRYASKLNEKQVTNLLRATCQHPSEREGSIMTIMQSNKYNDDALVNNEFGMRVREQFISIDARVLPTPPVNSHFYLLFFK